MLSVLEKDMITISSTGSRINKATIPSIRIKNRFHVRLIRFNCLFFFISAPFPVLQNIALSGSTLDTILLASSTNTKPTTDWNRPAAVVIPRFTWFFSPR